ncbi:MAG: MBL fold metallo-hydrolase, partial [Acidobacteriota bacterium]
ASQRQLQGIPGGTVYTPRDLTSRVSDLLALTADMEGGKPYDVKVVPVEPGTRASLRADFELVFFATSHWVETLGSRLDWHRRRLRPELAGEPEEEIRRRRIAGGTITEDVEVPLLAYLADTGPEVFDRQPELLAAEVLVVECTFLRPADLERARRFGHMHLHDLVELAPRLANRHLVVTHLSRRHRLGAGTAGIRRALAGRLAGELHTLNVEWE